MQAQEQQKLDEIAAKLGIDLNAIADAIRALPIPDKDKDYMVHHYNWTKIAEAKNKAWMADLYRREY